MKWILIKNGVVDNVILADQNFINIIKSKYDQCLEVEDDFYVGPKFTYNNGIFTGPAVQVEPIQGKLDQLDKVAGNVVIP